MWNDIALYGIPAYLALIVSIFLLVQDIQRYHLKLRIWVQRVFVLHSEGNSSIVLFDLAFVNPASRGKTVNIAKLDPLPGINDTEYSLVYDDNLEYATCLLPNMELPPIKFPVDQILQGPLDIPPHQSRCQYYPRILEFSEVAQAGVSRDLRLPFRLYVFDIDGKQMAKCEIHISLNELCTPKVYPSSLLVEIKP